MPTTATSSPTTRRALLRVVATVPALPAVAAVAATIPAPPTIAAVAPAMPAAGAPLHELVAAFRAAEQVHADAILAIDRYSGELLKAGVDDWCEGAARRMPEVEAAGAAASDRAEALGHRIAETPASDVCGVLSKLELLARDMSDAPREFHEELLDGAIADLRRLSSVAS